MRIRVEKENACIFDLWLCDWKKIGGDLENQGKKRRRSVAVGLMVACALKKGADVQVLIGLLSWHSILQGHKEDRLFSW